MKKELGESQLPKEQRQALFKLNLKLSTRIEDLLKELGIDLYEYNFSEDCIRGPAMCHGGNNPTGWSFYHSTSRTWKCWTNHCEEQYGRSCVGLIQAILKCSYNEAWKVAVKFIDKNKISDEEVKDLHIQQEKQRKAIKENYWKDHREPAKTFEENDLNELSSAKAFAEQRKLDPATFEKYKVGIANKGKLQGRVIIPIRNILGNIVGFSGRKIDYKKGDAKWFHWPDKQDGGLRMGIQLFNINNAFNFNVEKGKSEYILTEGPFDTLRLESVGIHNSVCVFGNGISEGQIEVLKQVGATKVYIAFDGDEPGRGGAERSRRKLEKKLISVRIIDLGQAYPDWSEDLYGTLDWANPYITPETIQKIIGVNT